MNRDVWIAAGVRAPPSRGSTAGKVTEFFPDELAMVLVVSAVEKDHVQMGVLPQVRRRALHDGDGRRRRRGESHGGRIDDREYRFGEPDRGDGIVAQPRHPKMSTTA